MITVCSFWRVDAEAGATGKHRYVLATCLGCYTQKRVRFDGLRDGSSTRCKVCAKTGGGTLEERVDMQTRVDVSGCWIWRGQVRGKGYPIVECPVRGRISVHRLALESKLGRPLATDELALHACDTPRCVNPDHLRVGTNADNVADCINKGRRRYLRGDAWRLAHMPVEQRGQLPIFGGEP